MSKAATIETTTPTVDETTPVTETPTPTAKAKTPKFAALDAERAAWVAANARPAVSNCLCGCGGSTKGRFVPGHDATLKEALKTGAAAGDQSSQDALATFGW